jgi:hypothetical protein
MKKSLSICFFIVCIAFISGCVSLPSGEEGGALFVKEIKDIGNGTYFEISADELKEQPEIAKSILGGEGCTKSDYGGWYCKLTEQEVSRVGEFFNIKHSKFLFNIDLKFKNNLDNNKIDAELVNTFKSNGFPLTEKYSTLAVSDYMDYTPYNKWFINKKVNSPEYVIYEIDSELKVYKAGYIEYQFVKIGEQYYEIGVAING